MHRPQKGLLVAAVAALAACSDPPVGPSNSHPPPDPGGTHTVSWNVGDECAAIAPAARQRTYNAVVIGELVTLVSGTFLQGSICTFEAGLGCNQFRLTQDGDVASIVIRSNEFHGGQIVERIEDGTWLEAWGIGTGTVEGSTIRATLDGGVWYCPFASSSPFPCSPFKACSTKSMQMTIVRKSQ
jgi:hypothetical protein